MTADGALRVLVVEDDPLTAEAHAAYVGRCPGFVLAAVARTGGDAIIALRRARTGDPIDVVLLDMNLPDMSGIDLCRSMRAAGGKTDVIAITAVRDTAMVRAAVSLGIVQYLIKPFSFAAFAAKLAAFREYRLAVTSTPVSDQLQVDAALARLNPAVASATLPKGISAETLTLVRGTLGAQPWISAAELAERSELSRATARRYLEYLVEARIAERRTRYGTPGRPEYEYSARAGG